MRISYATDFRFEPHTAPAQHVDVVCRQLAKRDHEVTLFAPSIPVDGPLPYTVVRTREAQRLRTAVVQPALLAALVAAGRRRRPDAIYARQGQLNVAPALAARLLRVPLVSEVNGRLLAESRQVAVDPLGRLLHATRALELVERFTVAAASRLVCVSDGIRVDLATRHPRAANRMVTVPNGVDGDRFRPGDRDAARAEMGLEPAARWACFVGALQVWQAVDQMIDAIALLGSEPGPPWHLLVVGDGPEGERLRDHARRSGAAERIVFTGAIPQDRVPIAIAAADVCLYYPVRARGEGASPFKVYEYLACGRPVVAADLAGVRDEFDTAVVPCAPEDPSALAGVLRVFDGTASAPTGHVRTWDDVGDELDELLRSL
jgi:glycosyltransferase involved in cell wall biosynthesis